MDELIRDFLAESAERLEVLSTRLGDGGFNPADREASEGVRQSIHAIRGACGFLNLPRLEAIAHAVENLAATMGEVVDKGAAVSLILEAIERMIFVLASLAQGAGERSGDDSSLIARIEAAASESPVSWQEASDGGPLLETPVDQAATPPERRIDDIRIPLKAIERIDSLVSDLIVTQNRLLSVAGAEAIEALREPLRRLAAIAGELRSESLAARLQPIGRLFANQQRLAYDVAKDLGRQIEVSFEGGDALLDRQLFGAVREALAELIRDAIDTDIEPPEDRRRLGKPSAGRIAVSARADADCAVIEVHDDGRGASPTHSTRSPGRAKGGVASVRAAIEDIGGSVAREARLGQGATTRLSIPLAVSAISALVVEAGADRFAAPRRVVDDLVRLGPGSDAGLEISNDGLVLRAKGDRTPAARLSGLMQSPDCAGTPLAPLFGLLMRAGSRRFAVVVDAVTGVQDLMFKALPRPMRHMRLFSGAAILQDGSPALMLSASGLADALDAVASSGGDGPDTFACRATGLEPPNEGLCRPTRLLVVEAAQPFQRMLERTLTDAGYEVQFAATMDEALETLTHPPEFDGVLADLDEAPSDETWKKRLGAFGRASSPRLLAFADHGGESVQSAARRAGFAAVAGKFDRRSILDALRASGLGSERRSAA